MTLFLILLAILVLLAGLILFLIFPASKKHPDLKRLNGLFIAHRGLHKKSKNIPENSLIAFKEAIEKGFAIENDIHLTADGEVVVFHDHSLNRMCGVDKTIEEMTLEEIKQYTLLGSDEKIPTLKECLDLVDGKVPILIEFKCQSLINCTALCEATDKILSGYRGKYFVQSFYPFVLKWYRKNRPDVLRGQLAEGFKGEEFYKRLLGNMLFNFISRPHFISYGHFSKNKIMFKLVKKLGGFPVGWTFESSDAVNRGEKDFNTYIFEDFLPEQSNLKK